MNKGLWMLIATAGLALASCSSSDHNNYSPVSSTNPGPELTDYGVFVEEQLQNQAPFGVSPLATGSLTTDQGLGDASAYGFVKSGTGDGLPAGTYQASLACTQAGQAACNPSVSADPNSGLN